MQTVTQWFRNAEAWLDKRGKGAWIAAMILGFIFLWPVGLALLFYMIWSNRMSCSHHSRRHFNRSRYRGTGNHAFDSYREETLSRLEDEQNAFQGFMERLRHAKDEAEFDQFMRDRKDNASNGSAPEAVPT